MSHAGNRSGDGGRRATSACSARATISLSALSTSSCGTRAAPAPRRPPTVPAVAVLVMLRVAAASLRGIELRASGVNARQGNAGRARQGDREQGTLTEA